MRDRDENVYIRKGGCAAGDKEVDSLEYQRLYANHSVDETSKKIKQNEAARNAKTYCVAVISNTPYTAASGECQRGDLSISESEYKQRKTQDANRLSGPPATPIVASGAPEPEPPVQAATVVPPPSPPIAEKPKQKQPIAKATPQDTRIPDDARAVSSGTAFFIADHGRLLTNHHVVEDCDWIGLMADDGLHSAVTLAESRKLDLAVLKTDFEGDGVAVFADETPEIGEDSYVAGYPLLDKLWSLNFTNGIISSQAPLGEERLLQTTAAVQHGNSGGPMFDASGHVAGVVVARLADSSAENVNFAIKSTVVTGFIGEAGLAPRIATRGADLKASAIAKSARAIVVPAICFKR